MNIEIPYNWEPRDYQLDVWLSLQAQQYDRYVLKWHRRSGKDEVCLHQIAVSAFKRVGNYWFFFPEYAQARKVLWEAINPKTGKKRIDDVFPQAIRKRTINDAMFIEFKNGSTFQLLGSDKYDNLVGASPVGIVFSEYAISNPSAWDYFRPMLLENKGWVIFNSTVRGKNHFYKLGELARNSPESWVYSEINVEKSNVFTQEQLINELKEIQTTNGEEEGLALFRQEYYNDATAAIPGAYYSSFIANAEKENRISNVPYDPMLQVTTSWDLGVGDDTVIWFAQQVGKEVRIIDYYENRNLGLEHYIKVIQSKPYVYFDHIFPHDLAIREFTSGKSRADVLTSLGIRNFSILEKASIEDRIQATRSLLPRCWFDKTKTAKGIEALAQYHREYDDKRKCFNDRPQHDWSSHAADSFGYLAQGLRAVFDLSNVKRFADNNYSILE